MSLIHPRQGMQLTNMHAKQRERITADEEERLRLSYEATTHHRAGGKQRVYQVRAAGSENEAVFKLTLEQGGEVLRVNCGREADAFSATSPARSRSASRPFSSYSSRGSETRSSPR